MGRWQYQMLYVGIEEVMYMKPFKTLIEHYLHTGKTYTVADS